MKKWVVALACAAVASVPLYLTFFRASEEDKVRKVMNDFAKIVMVKEGDTIISRAARMRSRMKDDVDDNVDVNVAELNVDVHGREKLEDSATKAGLMFQQADVDFSSVKIKIDPASTLATVDTLALVTSYSSGTPNPPAVRGGERKVDKRDVHFLLRKTDGDWKISSIDVAVKKDE